MYLSLKYRPTPDIETDMSEKDTDKIYFPTPELPEMEDTGIAMIWHIYDEHDLIRIRSSKGVGIAYPSTIPGLMANIDRKRNAPLGTTFAVNVHRYGYSDLVLESKYPIILETELIEALRIATKLGEPCIINILNKEDINKIDIDHYSVKRIYSIDKADGIVYAYIVRYHENAEKRKKARLAREARKKENQERRIIENGVWLRDILWTANSFVFSMCQEHILQGSDIKIFSHPVDNSKRWAIIRFSRLVRLFDLLKLKRRDMRKQPTYFRTFSRLVKYIPYLEKQDTEEAQIIAKWLVPEEKWTRNHRKEYE
jgi:hypothetical protein